jgi:hypothetical protein
VNSEGRFRLGATQANYDFMAEGNMTTEIKNALLSGNHKE